MIEFGIIIACFLSVAGAFYVIGWQNGYDARVRE